MTTFLWQIEINFLQKSNQGGKGSQVRPLALSPGFTFFNLSKVFLDEKGGWFYGTQGGEVRGGLPLFTKKVAIILLGFHNVKIIIYQNIR